MSDPSPQHDVLVIGGGLAGITAALAAQQAGARVLLASRSWGATALSTGALDLCFAPALAEQSRPARSLRDHLQDIVDHRPRHPYGVLGAARCADTLRQGHAVLERAVAGSGLDLLPLDLAAPHAAAASSLGTLVPAGGLFAPHRGLPLTGGARLGIVDFLGDASFAAERVMQGLRHDGQRLAQPPTWRRLPVRVPALAPLAMARAFDDPALQHQLELELQGQLHDLDALLLPPVLGLSQVAAVRARLQKTLALPVVEALGHMPSVPGVRLQQALDAALHTAGIERIGEIQPAPGQAGALGEPRARLPVLRDTAGQAWPARALVLCTGRFVAGGIGGQGRCSEQIFGLPLVTELGRLEADSPHPVVRQAPGESHPLMTAGVQVNAQLQPLRQGQVAHPQLFAAGMVLGGFGSRYTLCADGVALCTGWAAGTQAAAAAGKKRPA